MERIYGSDGRRSLEAAFRGLRPTGGRAKSNKPGAGREERHYNRAGKDCVKMLLTSRAIPEPIC